jgi:hypothetical protein
MVEVGQPVGDGRVEVTFRLPQREGIASAAVAGDFNDWSTTADPMEPGDDAFVARIKLEPGRRYRFRYCLDGDRWENDWNAHAYERNDYGGDDSVLDLTTAADLSGTGHGDRDAAPDSVRRGPEQLAEGPVGDEPPVAGPDEDRTP